MDKSTLVSRPKKIDLTLDLVSLEKEITSTDLRFLYGKDSGRGGTHDAVKGVFLRGHSSQFRFGNPSLEASNKYNSPHLEKLLTIKTFLANFPGKVKGRAALLLLNERSEIPIHQDGDPFGYFKNTLRFHVPIYTNQSVFFFNKGYFYHMAAGEVWGINNIAWHGVVNDGDEKRLHLVFDVYIDGEVSDFVLNTEVSEGIPSAEKPDLMEKIRWVNRKEAINSSSRIIS